MGPRRGKALAQGILFKVQVAGLELGSTPSQAQYKHFETKSPTNSANPLGWHVSIVKTIICAPDLYDPFMVVAVIYWYLIMFVHDCCTDSEPLKVMGQNTLVCLCVSLL